jgi:hypothetical protein
MMMVLGFTWRFNILRHFVNRADHETHGLSDEIRDALAKCRAALGKLLAQSGDFRAAVRLFKQQGMTLEIASVHITSRSRDTMPRKLCRIS